MGREWQPIGYKNPWPPYSTEYWVYEGCWRDAMLAVAGDLDQMILNLKGINNLVDEGILYSYLANHYRGSR